MKNFIIIFFSLSYFFKLCSANNSKILVSVVVDQMKYEYVDRFWDEFGEKGIKKLVNEGIFVEILTIIIFLLIQGQDMQVYSQGQHHLSME